MLKIVKFTCENLSEGCVTDESNPRFSFSLSSDGQGGRLKRATLKINGETIDATEQIGIRYKGAPLKAFTKYTATLEAESDNGDRADASLEFETGRMGNPWKAEWITDGGYRFTEKKTSPVPMLFRKTFSFEKEIHSAKIYATAIGIYELELNGKKVGRDYFAPGFTSYKSRLQYQTYDVTEQIKKDNTLTATVAGGWAVGAFVMSRKNRITAPRQAFLAELRVVCADGTEAVLGTDETWQVTREGPLRFAEFYDGEIFDATVSPEKSFLDERLRRAFENPPRLGSLLWGSRPRPRNLPPRIRHPRKERRTHLRFRTELCGRGKNQGKGEEGTENYGSPRGNSDLGRRTSYGVSAFCEMQARLYLPRRPSRNILPA